MVILVVAGVVGFALTAWWFAPGFRKRISGKLLNKFKTAVTFGNRLQQKLEPETYYCHKK